MERFKKIVLPLVLCLLFAVSIFVGCGPEEDTSDDGGTFAAGAAATAKITGSYSTPIQIGYSNMRPTYNMYTTTASYQQLTTYEGGTYCFVTSSSAASALDISWSDVDAGAKCNPRATSLRAFYGEYTTAAVEGDSNSLDITLTKAFRVIGGEVDSGGNILYCVDTDNWPDENSRRPNDTAAEWRLAQAWNTMTVRVNSSQNSFTRMTLTVAASTERTLQNAPAQPTGVVPGPTFAKTASSYFTLTDKTMGFEKLSSESYRVAFSFQMLLLYTDGTYCLFQSSAVAYNLSLAASGNSWNTGTGATGVEFTQYFGNYSIENNEFDDSLLNINMRKALRIVATQTVGSSASATGTGSAASVSGYYADTLYWSDAMSAATGKTAAAAFLEQNGFETSLVFATRPATTSPNSSFSYLAKDESGQMQPVR